MGKKHTLTRARLVDLFTYHPSSGWFTRNVSLNRANHVGERAGSVCKSSGYRTITIDRVSGFKEHQLAWFYMTGEWPAVDVDHLNRHRDDNRWCNLRLVTRGANNQNTMHAGVSYDSSKGTYRARIKVRGKSISLGSYADHDSAHRAYLSAKASVHPYWNSAVDAVL